MNISVKRDNLLKSLQSIIGVVERKQTMPILANVLINLDNNKLSITATDLEVELISTLNVKSENIGSFTAPGRKLLDICRALPAGAGRRPPRGCGSTARPGISLRSKILNFKYEPDKRNG